MRNKKLDQLIIQLETYLECWKQFSRYINIARSKKFDIDDENQFLEIKTVMTQELEMILASIECTNPSKEEVHALISNAPSLRYLSEQNEGALRAMENQWHKIYIGWQSMLGQLKVQQRQLEGQSVFSSLVSRKKS